MKYYYFKHTFFSQVEGIGQTTRLKWNSNAGMLIVGKLDMMSFSLLKMIWRSCLKLLWLPGRY